MTKSINVAAASTAELLAFYNANSGAAPVKRFSDRKTAERRVVALLADIEAAMPKKAPAAKKATYQQEYTNGVPRCPQCGGSVDITTGEVVETKTGQHIVNEHIATCHPCGHEWDVHTGKPRRRHADKVAGQRAAAISESWKDPAVAAARSTRHGVRVTDPRGGQGNYKSVRDAFLQLGLPIGRHIKFRGELKTHGKAEIAGYKFTLRAVKGE